MAEFLFTPKRIPKAETPPPPLKPASSNVDRAFPRIKLEPGQKIWEYLTALSKQIGLVLADDEDGNLLIRGSLPLGGAAPVEHLVEGQAPLISVTPQFSPQEYFSDVTVIVGKKRGQAASGWTARNPFLRDVVRTMTHKFDDVPAGGAKAAAEDHLARMLAACVSWSVELATAVTPAGELYAPNTLVQLTAPGAMIYGRHDFLIRKVTVRQNKDATTCSLDVVLPGAFSGEMPSVLPWSEPVA